jgi:hypothetical protein
MYCPPFIVLCGYDVGPVSDTYLDETLQPLAWPGVTLEAYADDLYGTQAHGYVNILGALWRDPVHILEMIVYARAVATQLCHGERDFYIPDLHVVYVG